MIDLSSIEPNLCEAISRFHFHGWLINYLKKYFSDGNNIEHQSFKSRTYTDDENTGLFIGDSSALDYNLIEKRPAILIQRRQSEISKVNPFGGEVHSSYYPTTETTRFTMDLMNMSYIAFCFGRTPAESEILSWETAGAINKLTRILALNGVVQNLYVDFVGEQRLVPESSRIYVTLVRIRARFGLISKIDVT
ncbi:MAG: hypothetical protein QW727_03815 [Candidatus Pacearchaeota archaeon]